MVYMLLRDGKMAVNQCHEIVPDQVESFVIISHAPAKPQRHR
jgi:hypothetical protein